MSSFITELYERLQESHRQKDVQKANITNQQIRFIENVVTVLSTKLRIASELIVILNHDAENNTVFLQLDGVFFRLKQEKPNFDRRYQTSSYNLYITVFSISTNFEWKDAFICELANLDLDILAEGVFCIYSLDQLIRVTADSQAYHDTNDIRTLVDMHLMRIFDNDTVIRLRGDGNNDQFRWVYQIGHRVVAYYQKVYEPTTGRKYFKDDTCILGYTFDGEQHVSKQYILYEYSPECIENGIVNSNPNTVFAAIEVMQVLGYEPNTSVPKSSLHTNTI